jgi:hypothetical protein
MLAHSGALWNLPYSEPLSGSCDGRLDNDRPADRLHLNRGVPGQRKGYLRPAPGGGFDGLQLRLGLMTHNNINTFSHGYDKLRFIK